MPEILLDGKMDIEQLKDTFQKVKQIKAIQEVQKLAEKQKVKNAVELINEAKSIANSALMTPS